MYVRGLSGKITKFFILGGDVDEERVPKNPPFTAFVGNLPYECTEDDIKRFFNKMTVKSVKLARDGGESGRLKGYGYAEFSTREELIAGLSMNGEVFWRMVLIL